MVFHERFGGALTIPVFDVTMDLTSAGGVVSVGVSVLLQVWVAGLSGVDVTTMWMGVLEVNGVSLTSTNHDKQSAALLQAPDIHSKVMLYVASSSDHLFTLLFAFLPFRNFCRSLWSLYTWQCQIPVDSSSTLLQHSRLHRLLVLGVLHFHWVSVSVWERNATGSSWTLCSCDNWAPQASSEASVYTM